MKIGVGINQTNWQSWWNKMDILGQLLLGIGAFALIVVVGSFVGIMMATIDDMIEEQRQAKERDKRRD